MPERFLRELLREDGHWPHDQDGRFRCCGVTAEERDREISEYQQDVRESDDALLDPEE